MILVTTAGKVGAEAARVLAGRGASVRVVARNPEAVTALAAVEVEVAAGDLEVPETIEAALRDVSAVVLVSPAVPSQELNVIAAAARAGVSHVVKVTSDASADSDIARRRGQAQIEAGLASSGLGYTLLRNNAYMQNLLMLAPAIAGTSAFASSTGEGRIGMIDARDVGAVAAEIALDPTAHLGRTYWPTGPEALSYRDAAATLSEVLGREITFRVITDEQQRQAMVDAGLPPVIAADNAKALRLFAQGEADYVTEDVPRLLGRPARSFERFATDHAAAFR